MMSQVFKTQISLISTETMHSFKSLLAICISPSMDCQFISFAHFSVGVCVYFLLICGSFYILVVNSLYVICIALQYFSQSDT